MRKSLCFFVLSILLLLTSAPAIAGHYTSDFSDYMASLDNGQEMTAAVITMADRVDLRALQDRLYAERADRRAWHEAVVRALQEKATLTQADLIARLETLIREGKVEKYLPLWVGNVIIVSATREALDEIAARPDVDEIAPDYEIENIEPIDQGNEPVIAGHEIGLERINADDCWAIGITGQGRLVSNIDTGVLGTHVALSDRWAGNDPRYTGHPEWAWLDPYTTNWPLPNDAGGHGTHTMGTICGRSDAGDTVGVAIDAQWIAAAAIDRGGGIPRTVSDAILSFQWIADPDSDRSTVWDVPDVCSNSWGVTTSHGYPPCDETFWTVIDGCEAAGCVVVFAAGNEGPTASSLRRPADRATTPLSTFSVGAVDGSNPSLPIASFSSRGPSNCTPDGMPTFKPEVVAPGVNVRSSYNSGGYTTMSGTSMACPHVSGVVALIRQANPNLTTEQVKQIIYDTAADLGDPGEDNTYGNGVVDAYAAVQLALSYLQGWGTLAGVVTDQATGNPIQGARVSAIDRGLSTTTRADGQYFLFMPADTAWTIKVENAPTHLPIYDTVTVTENDTLIQDYALEGKVTVQLMASFANPQNVSYRAFYLKGSWNEDGFYDAGWTAPAVAIRDNGVAPDQVAGDGIFTGSVMLARDLVNTYSWAIYSENYGGEASRLQNGSDFTIPTLDPPTVPTLAVNPSGSDNNWVISVNGDNGLVFDLVQNFNNIAAKWGASAVLDSGTTYTFRFRVMHSTVASYGNGGVGGSDISFTCLYSDNYQFSFDDRDDTYRIRLIGHPEPTNLTATSGQEFRVPLRWRQPQAEGRVLINNPPIEYEPYSSDLPEVLAKDATEPQYPPMLLGRGGPDTFGYQWVDSDEPDGPMYDWVDISAIGVEISPWPHGTVDDGYTDPIPMGMDFDFYGVTYGDIVVSTNGWVSFVSQTSSYLSNTTIPNTANPNTFIGVEWDDLDGGTVGHCYYYYDASNNQFIVSWVNWPYYPDATGPTHDIQVILNGNTGSIVAQYGDCAGAWQTDVTVGIENETGTDGLQVAYNQAYLRSDMAIWYGTQPEGTPPVHYKLYRATSPGVPIDPAHLINGSIDGNLTNFIDSYNLTNGTTYYYKLSAVWSDSVESPPSNEASATPANHPPLTPYAISGDVLGRTISITYSHDNSIGDRDHFNVYKKLMPGGTFTFVGSTSDTSYSFDIPIGEDGIYAVAVTAVDNGTPPLESGYSDQVLLPVGHLPPSSLVAFSSHESSVPLTWNRPGAFRLDDRDRSDEPDDRPIILGRGGPDGFGYQWIDSDEPDGPYFDWVDITGNGTEINPWPNGTVDNGYTNLIEMGMDFTFYGITYSSVSIGTNGWISFEGETSSHNANEPIPDNTTPNAYIAVEWDDLDGGTVGHCYYYYDSAQNRFIVSWVSWPYYPDPTDPHDFQVILYGNTGKIVTQYQNCDNWQSDVTVGIENETGTDGLQVTYNVSYLHNDLAIKFTSGPDGFQPDYYKLYRSTAAGFPIDPSNLINGHINGDLVDYTDTNNVINDTTYYYKLTAVWPDSVESPPTNEASATPTWGARMVADPLSFNVTGQAGQITTSNLTISNPGGLTLNYNILPQTDLRRGAPDRGGDGLIQAEDPPEVKSESDGGPDNPPMLLGRGGPDTFGYVWIDSDEPDGPTFNWVDITNDGVEITAWPHGTVDDGYTDLMPMGMTFNFYGIDYTDVAIGTNGWVMFNAPTSSYLSNTTIPNTANPNNFIGVEWDDLDGGTVGHCYYYYDSANNRFIVSWIGWPYYPDPTDPHDIQVILNGNGSIVTQYQNGSTWQSDVTVGIENADGTDGLQVAYNQVYLHNDLAIVFSSGWLSANPLSGSIAAGAQQNVTVIFDATLLAPGDYTGSLSLTGSDINRQVAPISIPVTFHVDPVDAIDDNLPDLPREFALAQNYPNPFNPTTEIEFDLPVRSYVNLQIFNVLGQHVKTLVDSEQNAGYRSVIWNGVDEKGQQVSSGTYFYILKAGDKVLTKKMTMLK